MSPVIIDVLDNDSHPDGDVLTVVFADVPNGQGSVTIVDGQYLVFDPGTDFDYLALGETTAVVITYVVSDSTGAIASSTATVTLTGINQAPVIAPVGETNLDEQTDTQPLNATIAVTFTDVDLNNVGHEAAVVGVAVNGEAGGLTLDNAALIALVSPGPVIKNAGDSNGSVDFFFTAGSTVFDYLAEGEIVTLTYTVEIDDGDGGTTQQTFDIVITGTNDAPVIDEPLSDVAATVVEDGFDASGNPVGNPNASGQIVASDVDNGERTFSVAQPNGSFGVFAITAAGAWTYTLDDAAADRLALGQTRTEVFEVTVTDGFGAIDQVLVTITVQGSNDAPRVQNVSLSAVEDGAAVLASFSGRDRDSDDNPGTLTYNVTQPGEGTVINHGDGTFSFDPGNDFQDLGEGVTRQVTFTYTATDSHGLVSAPATITVTVTGTNDVPVISGVSTGAVTEDAHPSTLTTSGVLTIVDPDAGESNFAPQSNVSGTYGTFTLLANGSWSYSADNTHLAIQSLRAGDQLTDSFTAVSSDGTASQTVTVTIHGVNDVAMIIGNAAGNVVEDVTTQASGTLTVLDVDSGENVFQAVPAANLVGTYGSFTFNALTGQWTYTLDNDAAHVQGLRDGQEVTDTLVVTSLDGTDSQTITVTITGVNDDATITGTATGTVTEDGASDGNPSTVQTVNGTLTVTDPDSGEDVFQAVPAANLVGTYGSFTFNELTGQWSYTLDNNAANVQALGAGQKVADTLVVTSLDGSVSKNITVTIVGSNDKPVISVGREDSDGAVLTADEATPTSFLMDIDSGDPIYTSGQTATVTFFISRGEGQAPEEVTVEFLMGPSHVATLANLIDAINAADNGLAALKTGNAFQFTLIVDGGALGIDDLSAVFTNPHIQGSNQFDLGVLRVIEGGTSAEGLSASGTLTVSDVDTVDVVNASVLKLAVGGSGADSLPDGLDADALLGMMSVGANPVIGSGDTTGSIVWTFDSGSEAFGFLDPNEALVLTYTITATDSAGAVTEHKVTITINGAGSDSQLLASSSDLEFFSAFMASTETIDEDSGGEVFVLTETDLTIDDLIIDYREGDVIDLTQLGFELATGQLNTEAAGEYVAYDQAAGVLWIDMDGAGDEAEFEAAAEFVTPPPSILVRLSDGDSTADIQIG